MANLTLKLSMIVIVVLFLSIVGGGIEGRLSPVTTPAEITKFESVENGYTRIWGTFTLSRPSCDFAGLRWSLIGASREIDAVLIFEGGTKERDGGVQQFGPWLVQLSKKQVEHHSKAIAYHRCPYRWWETETEFYPK